MALIVHNAFRHESLMDGALKQIAREFVGYGRPQNAEYCVSDDMFGMTLVFSSSIRSRQALQYKFTWPQSLTMEGGICKGEVALTLAYTPQINDAYGIECQRVSLNASLQQFGGEVIGENGAMKKDGIHD